MKYFIKTYGCQMNTADSEGIAGALEAAGMTVAGSMEGAEVIIINTCSVRQASEDKVYGLAPKIQEVRDRPSTPSRLAPLAQDRSPRLRSESPTESLLRFENSEVKVILTGCMVGSAVGKRKRADLGDLEKKLPWVDYFAPGGKGQIEGILRLIRHPEEQGDEGSLSLSETSPAAARASSEILRSARNDEVVVSKRKRGEPALVPISHGCNHFCSYCVVPYARGEEKSRPFEEIVCEVERLVEDGVEGVMLLGQNVNTYGKDFENKVTSKPSFAKASGGELPSPTTYESTRLRSRCPTRLIQPCSARDASEGSVQSYKEWFPRLLARLNEIKGLKKIEFLTSHPRDMSYELIDAIASLPKVSKYLHLPVQSGDDQILKKMNRGYTAQDYIDLVKKIRKKVPNLRLGTDVIVGFPGETEKQFKNTVKLFKKVKFDVAFIAMYSPRPGTAAAKLKDDVSKEEKKRRYKRLKRVFEVVRGN